MAALAAIADLLHLLTVELQRMDGGGHIIAIVIDYLAIADNSQAIVIDSQSMAGDTQTIVVDSQTIAGDTSTMAGDSQTIAGNTQTTVSETRAIAGNPKDSPASTRNVEVISEWVDPLKIIYWLSIQMMDTQGSGRSFCLVSLLEETRFKIAIADPKANRIECYGFNSNLRHQELESAKLGAIDACNGEVCNYFFELGTSYIANFLTPHLLAIVASLDCFLSHGFDVTLLNRPTAIANLN